MTSPASAQATAGVASVWRAEGTYPTDGRAIYTLTFRTLKFTLYKPDGVRQMKAKGRWQEAGEHGGWQNCSPPSGPWIAAGRTVPDALSLALAAPTLLSALQAMVALFDAPNGINPIRENEKAALALANRAIADSQATP